MWYFARHIGLAKLSHSWKSRCQTSFHLICGHLTAPIWTQSNTRSGAYYKNGFTKKAIEMSTSYDAGLLSNESGTSLTSVVSWRVAKETSSVCGCWWRTFWTQDVNSCHFRFFVSEFSDPILRNTAVLFSKNCLFCWIQCVLCASFCKCNYYYAIQRMQ